MAHPASRVLAMLELLQAHRHLTGPDLAARLGVDERTVRRYAGTLADLGIPVTTRRGRYGGYTLLPGFKLPPLMLTDDEAVAVLLGLLAAERLGLSTEAPAADAAAAKISRVLPRALADRLAALRESLGFTLREPPPAAPGSAAERRPPDTDTLLLLGTASRARERLAVTYRSWRGGVTSRDVDPYGVVFHAGRWYVVGHDHRSGEVRSLRVDRIAGARPAGARFTPPPDFDAPAFLRRQLARLPWTWEVEVLLEGDLASLRARLPATVGELTPAGDEVLLRCRVESLPGMAQMLAGLGMPFAVVAPDELRTAVAELAARLTESAARRVG
jgi:predicted DNA-binding transcriptional regulator YafY